MYFSTLFSTVLSHINAQLPEFPDITHDTVIPFETSEDPIYVLVLSAIESHSKGFLSVISYYIGQCYKTHKRLPTWVVGLLCNSGRIHFELPTSSYVSPWLHPLYQSGIDLKLLNMQLKEVGLIDEQEFIKDLASYSVSHYRLPIVDSYFSTRKERDSFYLNLWNLIF